MLWYFLAKQPQMPVVATNIKPDDLKEMLATRETMMDQFEKPLLSVFDLLVTKTALPIVTLMLGYLFGKRQS